MPLLLIHTFATLFMTGIIWFVQVVHYPLFDRVGASSFVAYEKQHAMRTGWVVGPVMCVEALTALALTVYPPLGVPVGSLLLGLVLVGIAWFLTAFLQVPQHRALARGYDAKVHRRLVVTNWFRTVVWTMRSVLVLWMLAQTN